MLRNRAISRWFLALAWTISVAGSGAAWAAPDDYADPYEYGLGSSDTVDDEKSTSSETQANSPDVEMIQERYPDGKIKIERHVVQDAQRNYLNHGPWTMWSPEGTILAQGQHEQGKRHGKWSRWFADGGQQFSGPQYEKFQKPFVSEASFVNGAIHGTWTMLDAAGQTISAWEFDHGQLHGKALWRHANGRIRREENYSQGVLDGLAIEWNAEGALLTKERYKTGKRHAPFVKTFPSGDKQVEGSHLLTNEETVVTVDWWNGMLSVQRLPGPGRAQRDGKWTYWYANGGKQFEGSFVADQPVGQHGWWHENGQRRIEGQFIAGKHDGRWTWWYANGQKQMEGRYQGGIRLGTWLTWAENGRIVEVQHDSFTPRATNSDASGSGNSAQTPAAVQEPARLNVTEQPDAAGQNR